MQSFRQILWRHAGRYGLVMAFVGATVVLLFNWAFYHEYPTHRRIVLYSVSSFIAVAIATVSNAWMEWRRSTRADDR
jgi:hypothetical protein